MKDLTLKKAPEPTLVDRLAGPHEWGYRDPVEGGFFEDLAPFEAAERIAELERRLKLQDRSLERMRYFLDKAQEQARAGAEARDSLASERAANERLTNELEQAERVATVQCHKLMLALERLDQMRDCMRQLLESMQLQPESATDPVIVRANSLVDDPLNFSQAIFEAKALLEDGERWRALRQMTWDKSPLAVVVAPKGKTALLGLDCPSHERLDQMMDKVIIEIRKKS